MSASNQSAGFIAQEVNTKSAVLWSYGLREQPFGVTPNPRFLYASNSHREALAALTCGLDNEVGFASLISEPGLGKTTLLFNLLSQRQHSIETVFIFNTLCSSTELIRQIGNELNLDASVDPLRLHDNLQEFLVSPSCPRPVLIVIDEAQNLDASALETVRLLSDFETPDRKLLHIVLAGQPELARKLQRPELAQLRQRIVIASRLEPLRPVEVGEYIRHRLRIAGNANANIFSESAVRQIAATSHGIPREINRLCFNALLLGCASGHRIIEPAVIDEVAMDLAAGEASHSPTPVGEPKTAANSPRDRGNVIPQVSQRTVSELSQPPVRELSSAVERPHRTSVPANKRPGKQNKWGAYLPFLCVLSALLGFAGWSSSRLLSHVPPASVVTANRDAASAHAEANGVSPSRSKENQIADPSLPEGLSKARTRTSGLAPVAAEPGNGDAAGAETASSLSSESANVLVPRAVAATKPPADPVPPPQIEELPPLSNDTIIPPLAGGFANEAIRIPTLAAPSASSRTFLSVPVKISGPIPVYPAGAKIMGLSGDVVMRVGVGTEGNVRSVDVISGNAALVRTAVAAVRQWKFRPYSVNGHPQAFETNVTVRFTLSPR